mmetsp:Transcript_16080/g.34495  ORF Transcript_16080/g.34495 Transcript_16080/m.34495 type:complete len:306 (+) Transcript_16080:395-1312(+)
MPCWTIRTGSAGCFRRRDGVARRGTRAETVRGLPAVFHDGVPDSEHALPHVGRAWDGELGRQHLLQPIGVAQLRLHRRVVLLDFAEAPDVEAAEVVPVEDRREREQIHEALARLFVVEQRQVAAGLVANGLAQSMLRGHVRLVALEEAARVTYALGALVPGKYLEGGVDAEDGHPWERGVADADWIRQVPCGPCEHSEPLLARLWQSRLERLELGLQRGVHGALGSFGLLELIERLVVRPRPEKVGQHVERDDAHQNVLQHRGVRKHLVRLSSDSACGPIVVRLGLRRLLGSELVLQQQRRQLVV